MGLFRKRRQAEGADPHLLARMDGKEVKYVTRRELDESGSPVESVIGKEGRLNTQNDRIVVVCNGTEVFRCPVEGAKCGELLSLEGVVIQGVNAYTGAPDTIVAYYQYYR